MIGIITDNTEKLRLDDKLREKLKAAELRDTKFVYNWWVLLIVIAGLIGRCAVCIGVVTLPLTVLASIMIIGPVVQTSIHNPV